MASIFKKKKKEKKKGPQTSRGFFAMWNIQSAALRDNKKDLGANPDSTRKKKEF